MRIVGITGGIGSGKTTVCKIFEALGVPVYYADDRAKFLMANDSRIKEKIIAEFGEEAFEQGKLNRVYLAQQVFNSESKLQKLNAIVHPVVAEDFEKWSGNHSDARYVMKEAAILFESGAYQRVDTTVLINAPEKLRLERVMKRDGSSENDVLQRMRNQWTDERKAKLADHMINNDGFELLIPQVLELHRQFCAL